MQDVGRRHAEAREVLYRQVDAVLASVFAHVANDVGQLKGDAEVLRIVERALIAIAEDAGREKADDARNAIAVRLEARPVEVARLAQIHLHAVDDFLQARGREAELLAMRLERTRHGMVRLAGEERGDFAAPPRELRGGDLWLELLIHYVIDFAAERVERGDGAAALRRQKQERVVEA